MKRTLPPKRGLTAVKSFLVGERYLDLYFDPDLPLYRSFSLYWDGEESCIRHEMTYFEVFDVLSGFLEEKSGQKPEVIVRPKGVSGGRKKPAPPPICHEGPYSDWSSYQDERSKF